MGTNVRCNFQEWPEAIAFRNVFIDSNDLGTSKVPLHLWILSLFRPALQAYSA